MADFRNAATIADLREIARKRLPEFAFVPVETGDGDGTGPRRNVDAFRRIALSARALVDVTDIRQETVLFGKTYASPFGISAVGYANNLRRNADQMLAEAAVEANIPFMLSGGSTAAIEEIARIAPEHAWQQLYAARDRAITGHFVGRARDAGVRVLVHTVDSPIPPRNDWLARSGIALPASVRWSAWPYVLWQALTHPRWSLAHAIRGGLPRLESWAPYAPSGSGAAAIAKVVRQNMPAVETWRDVEYLRKLWPGVLVVKGLVDPSDARRALELGVDAVTVSNHGGNKLDRMAAAIDTLPLVAPAVEGGMGTLLFDGGIRRGTDILTALALGADYCFVGRATLYGVIAGGTAGASRAITILKEEIGRALALIGCSGIAELGPHILHHGDRYDD